MKIAQRESCMRRSGTLAHAGKTVLLPVDLFAGHEASSIVGVILVEWMFRRSLRPIRCPRLENIQLLIMLRVYFCTVQKFQSTPSARPYIPHTLQHVHALVEAYSRLWIRRICHH